MVYCTKCGTQNADGAKHCTNCGASLEVSLEERFERGVEEWGEGIGRRMENECFGLPRGGAIAGIVFGVIIILVGTSWLLGIEIDFWPLIVIIFGILIVAGALYGLGRRR